MVTPMQQPQEGEVRRNRRTGATATYRGGQWYEEAPAQSAPQGQPGLPGFVPMETPQQRTQAEERQYDRQRDTARDQLTASREERANDAARRQAEAAERAAQNLTDKQSDSLQYGTMMRGAEADYQSALEDGYRPTSGRNMAANILDGIPWDGGAIPALIRDPQSDRGYQAERRWAEANLRQMTGAAAQAPEITRVAGINFDRANDDLSAQRYRTRQDTYGATRMSIGSQRELLPEDYPTRAGDRPLDANGLPEYGIQGGQEARPIPAGADIVRGPDGKTYTVVASEDISPQEAERLVASGEYQRDPSNGSIFRVVGTDLPPGMGGGGGPPAQASHTGPISSAGDAFSSSAVEQFPWGAKLAARAASMLTGEDYDTVRRIQQDVREYDRENHGTARNVGGVAGFAAPFVTGAGAGQWIARGPNMAYQAVRGAAVGAPVGAVFGSGEAEDGRELEGARSGAFVGGVTGGVAPPIGRAVGWMTNGITRPLIEGAGDLLSRFTRRPMTGEDRAVRSMMRGVNHTDATARLEEGRRFGANLTAADVGGSNVQGRVRVAATRQTPGREVAEDFSAGRRSEMQDYAAGLGERVSPVSATPDQLDTALEAYQRNASRPAFDAARASPPVQLPPEIAQALYGTEGRAAMNQAARLYRSSPDPAEQAIGAEIEQLAARQLAAGEPVEVSVGVADLITRYLQNAGGTDRNAQRILGNLGTAVRDSARTQSGAYDTALTDYASRARLGGAVETGERFLGSGHTGDFVAAAGGMDDAQRAIALPAARAAIERASETAGTAPGLLDKLATGRGQQQRSAALLGVDAAADLQQGAQVGRRMVSAGNNVNPRAGSATFLNAQDAGAMQAGSIAGNLFGGRPLQAIGGVVDLIRSAGISDEQAEMIVRLATDPNRTEDVLQILRTRFPDQEARRIVSELTPLIASQAGAASAPQQQPRLMTGSRPQ